MRGSHRSSLRALAVLLVVAFGLTGLPVPPAFPPAPAVAQTSPQDGPPQELFPPDPVEPEIVPEEEPPTLNLPDIDPDGLGLVDLLGDLVPDELTDEFTTLYRYPDVTLPDPPPGVEVPVSNEELLAGRQHVARIGAGMLNYVDSAGVLRPIEKPTLEDVTVAGVVVGKRADPGPYSVFFPSDLVPLSSPSPTQGVEITIDGSQMEVFPTGVDVQSSGLIIDQDGHARYSEVRPDTDLVYEPGFDGVKELVVLNTPEASPVQEFEVRVPTGVTLVGSGNAVEILRNGELIGYMPPPLVYDSGVEEGTDHPYEDDDVEQIVLSNGTGSYLVQIKVTEAWFRAPERTFPVIVDPGFKATPLCQGWSDHWQCGAAYPQGDALVAQNKPAKNYGDSHVISVGNKAGWQTTRRSFLRFSFQGLRPASWKSERRVVYKGHLLLGLLPEPHNPAGWKNIPIRRVRNDIPEDHWLEGQVTWNNRPANLELPSDTISSDDSGWLRGRLKADIQGFLDQSFGYNNGWRIESGDPDKFWRFYSKDAGTVAGVDARPFLWVVYNDTPPKPTLAAPAHQDLVRIESPTLRINQDSNGFLKKDINEDPVFLRYQVSTSEGFEQANIVAESPWDRKLWGWPVPPGKLVDGQQYFWRVQARDDVAGPGGSFPEIVTSDARSFSTSFPKLGDDERWAMWRQPLGNGIDLAVNQATGNLYLDYSLESFPTSAGPLDLRLTYNSQKATGSPKGWTIMAGPASDGDDIPVGLEKPPYGGVLVVFADGNQHHFPHLVGNTYGSIGGGGTVRATNDEDGNETEWLYTTPTGGTFLFKKAPNENRRYLEQARPISGTWSEPGFTYEFDAGNRLKTVAGPPEDDGSQVSVTVDYGLSPPRITAKREKSGEDDWLRVWDLGISIGGNLDSVQDPTDATVGFTYAGPSGELSAITDGEALQTTIGYIDGVPGNAEIGLPAGPPVVSSVTLPGQQSYEFAYKDWWGYVTQRASVTDPRGVETPLIAEDFLTYTWFNTAGYPRASVGPVEADAAGAVPSLNKGGAWPWTTQLWDENGNLVCRRTPAANAGGLGCWDSQNPKFVFGWGDDHGGQWPKLSDDDGKQTDYTYQPEEPHLVLSETLPENDQGQRAATTYQYDEPSWDELYAERYTGLPALTGMPSSAMFFPENTGGHIRTPNPELGETGWAPAAGESVRLTGKILIPNPGRWEFRVRTDGDLDEGVRIVVGGKLFQDCWRADRDCNAPRNDDNEYVTWFENFLGTGEKDILIEYVNRSGPGKLNLQWDLGKRDNWQTIPAANTARHDLNLLTHKFEPGASPGESFETVYTYAEDDRLRRRVTSETKGTRTTRYEYWPDDGSLKTEIDPRDKSTRYGYTAGCLTKLTDRTGKVTEYVCSPAGDVLEERRIMTGPAGSPDPPDRVTTFTYDKVGREERRDIVGRRTAVASNHIEAGGTPQAVEFTPGQSGTVTAELDWDPLPSTSTINHTGTLAELESFETPAEKVEGEAVLEADLEWEIGSRPATLSESDVLAGGASRAYPVTVQAKDHPITGSLSWESQQDTFAWSGTAQMDPPAASAQSTEACPERFDYCIDGVDAPGPLQVSLETDSLVNMDIELWRPGGTAPVATASSPIVGAESLTYSVPAEESAFGQYRVKVTTLHPQETAYTADGSFQRFASLQLELLNPAGVEVAIGAKSWDASTPDRIKATFSHDPVEEDVDYVFEVSSSEDPGFDSVFDLIGSYPEDAFAAVDLELIDAPGVVEPVKESGSAGKAYLSYNAPDQEGIDTYRFKITNTSADTDIPRPGFTLTTTKTLVKKTVTADQVLAESQSRIHDFDVGGAGALRADLLWEKGTKVESKSATNTLAAKDVGVNTATHSFNVTANDSLIDADLSWGKSAASESFSGTAGGSGSTGTASASACPSGRHCFDVNAPGDVVAELTWTDVANLDLWLRRPDGVWESVETVAVTGPEELTFSVPDSTGLFGQYQLEVRTDHPLSVAYDVSVDYFRYPDLTFTLKDPGGNPVQTAVTDARPSGQAQRTASISYQPVHTPDGSDSFGLQITNEDELVEATYDLDWTYPISARAKVEMKLARPDLGPGESQVLSGATGELNLATTVTGSGSYDLTVRNESVDTDIPDYDLTTRVPTNEIEANLDIELVDASGAPVPGAQIIRGRPEVLTASVEAGQTYRFLVDAATLHADWRLEYELPGEEFTATVYDHAGRVKRVTTADGHTDYTYDPDTGRLAKEQGPSFDGSEEAPQAPETTKRPTTRYEYDGVGNVTQTIVTESYEASQPVEHVWTKVYDAQNRVVEQWNPFCAEGTPDFDPARCGKTVTDYDFVKNTAAVTDPSGIKTVTTFDLLGRVVSEVVRPQPLPDTGPPTSVVQNASASGRSRSASSSWPQPTSTGNLLLAAVTIGEWGPIDFGTTVNVIPPAGWTLAKGIGPAHGHPQVAIFYIENADPRSGTESFLLDDLNESQVPWSLTLAEFSGVEAVAALDKTASNSGVSEKPDTGTTAITSEADELIVGVLSSGDPNPSDGIGFTVDGTDYTALYHGSGGSGSIAGVWYRVAGTTQEAILSASLTGGSDQWAGAIVTLKTTGAGADLTAPIESQRQYDLAGNLTREELVTDRSGEVTYTEYREHNAFGQPGVEAVGGTGSAAESITAFDYRDDGLLQSLDGPRTDVIDDTTYEYDHEGRLTKVTDPGSEETLYAYNDAGELTKVTDADGRVRTFTYDAWGHQRAATDARGTTSMYYGASGRLVAELLPNGDLRNYEYDRLGRQTSRSAHRYGDGAVTDAFSYDLLGNMETAGQVGWTYDAGSRPTEVKVGGVVQTSYAYDPADRVTQRSDPAGQMTLTYNRLGLLESASSSFAGTTTWTYDDAGRATTRTDPTLVTTTRAYDRFGLVDTQAAEHTDGSELAFVDLDHDLAGNVNLKRTRFSDPSAPQGTWTYTHDGSSRLQTATDPAGVITAYGWDGAGNRTSVKVGTGPEEITDYDGAGHPIRTTAGTETVASYETDAAGTLLGITEGTFVQAFAYDPLGRLAEAKVGGEGIAYAYDALDRTVSRTARDLATGTQTARTDYAYTGASHELAQEVTGPGITLYANTPSGPLARSDDGAVSHLLRDPHGDVTGTVSAQGLLAEAAAYDPFGVPIQGPPGTLGFQGDVTDPATGLVDMTARLYAPTLGRFTTADPLFGDVASPLTLNPHAYALGNPVTLSDPLGLCPPQYCYDEAYHGDEHGNSGHSPESASRLVPPQTAPVLGHDPKTRLPAPPKLDVLLRITDSRYFNRRLAMARSAAVDVAIQGAFSGGLGGFQGTSLVASIGWGPGSILGKRENMGPGGGGLPGRGYSGGRGSTSGGGGPQNPLGGLTGSRFVRMSSNLRLAKTGRGNLSGEPLTLEDAWELGAGWVGSGSATSRSGNAIISADRTRVFRPPTYKPNVGEWQANLERVAPIFHRQTGRLVPIANLHIPIVSPGGPQL